VEPRKSVVNQTNHVVSFPEASAVFEDALLVPDLPIAKKRGFMNKEIDDKCGFA
jgi:hypothetical protein